MDEAAIAGPGSAAQRWPSAQMAPKQCRGFAQEAVAPGVDLFGYPLTVLPGVEGGIFADAEFDDPFADRVTGRDRSNADA